MSKASEDSLAAMHAALADRLTDVLKNGEVVKVVDKETGDVTVERVTPSPAMLNQIRQFLKDNHIEIMPGRNAPMGRLVDALPEFADDPVALTGPDPQPE